jgi:hypothetical protein
LKGMAHYRESSNCVSGKSNTFHSGRYAQKYCG